MNLVDYLNSIYQSDNLDDYQFRKIDINTADIAEADKELFELTLDIIQLNEQYREKEEVFKQYRSTRLPKLEEIKKEDLFPLPSLDLKTIPLPFQARLADFLWTTIKDCKSAKIAIESYILLYDSLWNGDNWTDCVDMISRAKNIAVGYNRNGKEYKKCIEKTNKDWLAQKATILYFFFHHFLNY